MSTGLSNKLLERYPQSIHVRPMHQKVSDHPPNSTKWPTRDPAKIASVPFQRINVCPACGTIDAQRASNLTRRRHRPPPPPPPPPPPLSWPVRRRHCISGQIPHHRVYWEEGAWERSTKQKTSNFTNWRRTKFLPEASFQRWIDGRAISPGSSHCTPDHAFERLSRP